MPVIPRFVVVALPCTRRLPVVVAPPEIVRPPVCEPLPIVVDAVDMSPPENVRSVEVAFEGKRYEKLARPSDDVAVSV